MSQASKLVDYAVSNNIAEMLDDETLAKIAEKVKQEADIDKLSMSEWMDRNNKAMEIAMQIQTKKTFPWEGASNVMYPLITNGAITFAAREYPQIVRGQVVVDAAVFGKDKDGTKVAKGRRLSKHMSWQLLVESDTWEGDTDKMLATLAVIGTVFRKGYYNPTSGKPCFEVCRPDHIYINNNIQSVETARRITHVCYLYLNQIVEKARQGLFCEYDDAVLQVNTYGEEIDSQDSDKPHEIFEQHRYLDLDEDGYQEPYIVTYHVGSGKILSIVARYDVEDIMYTDDQKKIKCINPTQYFIDYHFLPSPEGKFLSLGLGTLLYPLNETVNTTINQIIDSGTLLNAQPMFIAGTARIDAKMIKLQPGKINKIEGLGSQTLRDSLMQLPLLPPSPVLQNLLEYLVDAGKELAGTTEILTGQQPSQNSPATTVLALIKQGLVQYNAVHKRVLRSLKKEFGLLYKLNSKYLNLETYLNMIDDENASADDYKSMDMDVRPIADPNMASETQRLAKAQAVYQLQEVDRRAAAGFMLDAMDVEDYEVQSLLPPIDPQNPPPPPPDAQKDLAQAELFHAQAASLGIVSKADAAKLELDMQKSQREHELNTAHAIADIEVKQSNVKVNNTQAVKNLADAEKAKKEADYVGHEPVSKPK
jgi:chaperonin GroES